MAGGFNVNRILQMVLVTALSMAIINRIEPLRRIVSPGPG